VAAGIPLLLALTAVFATFGLATLPSHLLPIAQEASAVVLLVGLAVGVDYSMFYLRREREERAAGRSEREALEVAAKHPVARYGMVEVRPFWTPSPTPS
jgi:RND superfamily putative drug exporter